MKLADQALRLRSLVGGFALLSLFALAGSGACSSESSGPPVDTPSTDAAEAEAALDAGAEANRPPDETGPQIRCTLDNGGDPVGLCVQKMVLQVWHEAAFDPNAGVAQSWDSTTFAPDTDPQGVRLQDPKDDVAFGASLARYHASSGLYGDNEITPLLDQDLLKLAPIIMSQFSTMPQHYDGDLYHDLRAVAGGLRVLNHTADADKIDAIAESYGRAIFDNYYRDLPSPIVDAGAEAADGSPSDAQGDAVSEAEVDAISEAQTDSFSEVDGSLQVTGNGIIGIALGADAIEYEPASVATAALALLDLAARHSAEEPLQAQEWQRAAVLSLRHLWDYARDPGSGMLYRTMKNEGVQDAPSGSDPKDVLLVAVQSTVALALMRSLELVEANPTSLSVASTVPWLQRTEALIAATNNSALWDSERGGYYEGRVASSAELLSNKSTRGNGYMLAALHRAALVGSSPYVEQVGKLRTLLLQRIPAHTSLISTQEGQLGFFLSVPADFEIDNWDAGVLGKRSYYSRANAWACESMDDGWFQWN